jgi:Protein of unknown function (DUF1194)
MLPMDYRRISRLATVALSAAILSHAAPARTETAQTVDIALVVAIDVSFSVDSTEHRLQMEGFATALESEEVLAAITSGPHQKIAIVVFEWSGEQNQGIIIPWAVISDETSARQAASILAKGPRSVAEGGTAIASALTYGSKLFASAPNSPRHVIDLSTDGRNNAGIPASQARDAIVVQGITINGLAITNEWAQLATYLEKNVIGGGESFVITATNYDDFAAAMQRKLVKEITGPGNT